MEEWISSNSVLSTSSKSSSKRVAGEGGRRGGGNKKTSSAYQSQYNHSIGSLLSTMDSFVRSVDEMNETILVPIRLMDLGELLTSEENGIVSGKGSDGRISVKNTPPSSPSSVAGGGEVPDLYSFYTTLNTIKNELLWGSAKMNMENQKEKKENFHYPCSTTMSISSSASSTSSMDNNSSKGGKDVSIEKGHVRRPSTVSTISSSSNSTGSEQDFCESNEDSGVEVEEEYSQQLAENFHQHLNGLQNCLKNLTLSAETISKRYALEMGCD